MGVVISGPDSILAANSSFAHEQLIPATVWGPIEHDFGYRPAAVTLFSADYSQQFSEFVIQHLDENTLRISMNQPTAGVALIAR